MSKRLDELVKASKILNTSQTRSKPTGTLMEQATGPQTTAAPKPAIVKPSVQAAREKQYGVTDGGSGAVDAVMPTVIKPSELAELEQQYEMIGREAPIVTTRSANAPELVSARPTEARTWFEKGAFADGWQVGDLLKTVGGTATDVKENATAGVLGIGENVLDALAYIAPLIAQGQYYQNGGEYQPIALQQAFDESIAAAKKGAADFIKEDLYDEKAVAEKLWFGNADNSVLGDKTDALVQSAGQMVGTAALQAAGVPWFVTTGATAFGGQTETALNEGAGYEQAGASAAISAGAEILSEKLSGGIKFGGKTLDDLLLKPLTDKIANKTWKALVNLGIDAVGEGLEEVFSSVLSRLGTALYKEENLGEILASEEALNEYIESFIGGSVMGGGSSLFKSANQSRADSAKPKIPQTEQQAPPTVDSVMPQVQPEQAQQQQPSVDAVMPDLGQNKTAPVNETEAESTAVDTNPAAHTPQEQAVIEDYQNQTDEALKETFESYLNDPKRGFSRHNISSVSAKQADDASRILGGDYTGYKNAINSNSILHILNDHGPNGTVDNSLGDLNDISRIGYVLANYDTVEQVTYESGDADTSAEFRTKDNRPAPMLKYSKKVNGTYYVVEAIPESKYKKFWVVSAYMEKADGGTQAPNANGPGNTPNASLASNPAASTSNIPNQPENVNGENIGDMGAADEGFNAYSHYQTTQDKFIPEGANATRPVDVPATDPTGKNTRRYLSNAMGAQSLNEGTDAKLQDDFMSGKYGYEVKGDKAAVDAAKAKLESSNYDTMRGTTLERLESLKDLKQTIVDAQILAVEAMRNGRDADAAELFLMIATTETEFGQAVQAASILRKLSPEGQLEAVRRVAARLDAKAKGKKAGGETVSQEEQAEIMHTVDDVRETALRLLENIHEAFDTERDNGVPVEDWLKEIGKELAKTVGAKPSTPGPKPISRIIKHDLLKFAKDYLGKKPQIQERTAVETLTDFLANRTQYVEAWNRAKQAYVAKFGNDTDFAGATITYNADGSDPVMVQAIVEEATKAKLKERNIDIRTALGDQTALENQIADGLISDTGATGADVLMLRDAVKRYFNETRLGTNAETVNNNIKSDISKNIQGIGKKMSDIIRSSQGDKAAVANQIANMMVNQYGVSPEAARTATVKIIDQFNNMVAEKSEKALESMFKDRGEKPPKTVMRRFSELANMGAFTSSKYNQKATQKLFGEGLQVDPDLAQKFLDAPDEASREAAMEEIYKDLGSQMDTTFGDVARRWRYTAMLLNPSTHIKNISGNATQLAEATVKDAIAAVGEGAVDFVVKAIRKGKGIQRTKALLNPLNKADAQLLEQAGADYANVMEAIEDGSKWKDTPEGKISQYKTIMKLNNPKTKAGKAVDTALRGVGKVADFNEKAMNVEDSWFAKPKYQAALAGYMKANNLTKITDAAREYAIQEAKKSTYRDSNAVSDFARSMGNSKKKNWVTKSVDFLVNAIFPFKGTPANVGVRAVEYSPVGLISTVSKGAYNAIKGQFSAAAFIDDLSANVTGTALMGVGMWLAQMGILRAKGAEDDKEKEQLEKEGYKDNSINVFGYSIPISTIGAGSVPLLLGAAVYENFVANNPGDEGHPIDDFLSALSGTLDPVLETTMLVGFQDAIQSFQQYDPEAEVGETFALAAVDIAGNYIASFIPTLMSRIANSTDESARQVYVDKNKDAQAIQRVLQTLQKKIPGLRNQMTEVVDAYGNTVEGGLPSDGSLLERVMAGIGNAVTPIYGSKIKTTAVDEEIRRLYNADGITGDYTLITPDVPKSFEVGNQTVYLTGDQYVEYQKTLGSTVQTIRDSILNSEAYENLSDDIKAAAMSDAYEYANALAKTGLGVGYKGGDKWMQELYSASPEVAAQAILERSIDNAAQDKDLYENKYLGLEDMLETNTIDDQLALACMSDSAYGAYDTICKPANVSVQQFLDVYGTAYSAGENNEEKRSAALDRIQQMDIPAEQKTALAQAVFRTFQKNASVTPEVPDQWLLDNGDTDTIVAQMSDTQRQGYDAYIKDSSVDMQTYLDFYSFASSDAAKTEKDENGKEIKGKTRQDKIIAYLEKLDVSDEVKGRLFCSEYSRENCPMKWRVDVPGD